MNISVVGTGYVGLVTGVCLADIGHDVTCIEVDNDKVDKLKNGISPIYEPGLGELMKKNMETGRLHFTDNHSEGFRVTDIIFIAVGTPQKKDGSADLTYVDTVAKDIAKNINQDVIIVTKSTVPVGTNERIKQIIEQNLVHNVKIDIVSNPEFLREGSAVYDTFHGDRIVIGADNEQAALLLEEVYKPFGVPIYKTDIRSAEMIKYASNAFLATKISFINEISTICEKLGANVEDVAFGMGLDERIGSQFLRAGIGYGGSCFPKDTSALVQIAGGVDHDFELLKSVIKVNNTQRRLLVDKARSRFGSLRGKRIALLGLAFKPNTNDMREAASIVIAEQLVNDGAMVVAYDPIAMNQAKKVLPKEVIYASTAEQACGEADAVMILTEWDEFKHINLQVFEKQMKQPVIFDGRNLFDLEVVKQFNIEYHSIGRPVVKRESILVD